MWCGNFAKIIFQKANKYIEAEMPIYFLHLMTRDKEVWKAMTKFDYEILMLLNEKNVDNSLKAINISQILEYISVAKENRTVQLIDICRK